MENSNKRIDSLYLYYTTISTVLEIQYFLYLKLSNSIFFKL